MKRAMQRVVVRTGPNRFRVEGRAEPWYDVELGAMQPCHCGDHCWRGEKRDCIHLLAVRLFMEAQ